MANAADIKEPPVESAKWWGTEMGADGTRRSGRVVVDDWLPEVIGVQRQRTYATMARSALPGAVARDLGTNSMRPTWTMRPKDDSPLAVEISDHCSSCITDIEGGWETFISSATKGAGVHGFVLHEMCFKERLGLDAEIPSNFNDGKIGIAGLRNRRQDSLLDWEWDKEARRPTAFRQYDYGTGATLTVPLVKCLHTRMSAENENPEGESMYRNVLPYWLNQQSFEELEAIGAERDAVGLLIYRLNIEALKEKDKPAAIAKARGMLRRARRGETEGLVMDAARDGDGNLIHELFALPSPGARQFDLDKIITRYDQRILIGMGYGHLLLGHAGVGSLGQVADKGVENSMLRLEGILDQIAAQINAKLLPWLVRLNGWPTDLTPTITHSKIEEFTLTETAAYLGALAKAGMPIFPTSDGELEEHLLTSADLPVAGSTVV